MRLHLSNSAMDPMLNPSICAENLAAKVDAPPLDRADQPLPFQQAVVRRVSRIAFIRCAALAMTTSSIITGASSSWRDQLEFTGALKHI